MGKKDGKTMLLLPGTACTWQINFHTVIDRLAQQYHLTRPGSSRANGRSPSWTQLQTAWILRITDRKIHETAEKRKQVLLLYLALTKNQIILSEAGRRNLTGFYRLLKTQLLC